MRANDPQLECVTRVTPENEDGSACRGDCGNGKGGYNSVYYLDRQNVDCGAGYVLQSFKLKRGRSGQTIYYEYVCCTGKWLYSLDSKLFPVFSGPTHLADGASAIYLGEWGRRDDGAAPFFVSLGAVHATCLPAADRNQQQCGTALLQKFQLTRGADALKDLYQYNYTCQNISTTAVGSCVDVSSRGESYNDNKNGDIRYLDRLVADCSSQGPLYVMSGWAVGVNTAPSNKNWHYKYRCCPVNLGEPGVLRGRRRAWRVASSNSYRVRSI